MSENNQGGAPEENHYDRFEQLPRAFRLALQEAASEDLQVGWIETKIRWEGYEQAYAYMHRQLASRRRILVMQHYGEAHPQSGSSRGRRVAR